MPRKYSADEKQLMVHENSFNSEVTDFKRQRYNESPTNNILGKSQSALEQLKKLSIVVADTGEINTIAKYMPQDATTNPSLIYKASTLKEYEHVVQDAIEYALKCTPSTESKIYQTDLAMDRLAVNFGTAISKLVPGYVSTEVDARLSFNINATVERGRRMIKMYEELGVDKSRILIKIAATYEGIKAGEILEKEGIHCNLTLIFSLIQAAACAQANITLISPFVGRILDWYKAKTGIAYTAETDPGVISVAEIYRYMRKFDYNTIVMGASFRNLDEILALAGCDRLTIAPALLAELETADRVVQPKLSHTDEVQFSSKVAVDEASFRFSLNENAMATEKLAEGIRGFSSDLRKLEELIAARLNA